MLQLTSSAGQLSSLHGKGPGSSLRQLADSAPESLPGSTTLPTALRTGGSVVPCVSFSSCEY